VAAGLGAAWLVWALLWLGWVGGLLYLGGWGDEDSGGGADGGSGRGISAGISAGGGVNGEADQRSSAGGSRGGGARAPLSAPAALLAAVWAAVVHPLLMAIVPFTPAAVALQGALFCAAPGLAAAPNTLDLILPSPAA
jgi:hypothetical protein